MFGEVINEIIEKWWSEVCSVVQQTVVFLDNGAAECLHWHGGLLRLINAGASNVQELSSFEKASDTDNKAVFVVTTPLFSDAWNMIHDVITASNFFHCTVITNTPPMVHSMIRHGKSERLVDEKHVFERMQALLLKWMGNAQNSVAEVMFVPIFATSVIQDFILMPPFADIFPPLKVEATNLPFLAKEEKKSVGGAVYSPTFSEDVKLKIKCLVHSLNCLLDKLHVREEIFTLGSFSSHIGAELENLPATKSRRKVSTNRASLLLVDRTLDLAGPLSHNMESLLDRIVRTVPHLPGHSCDVAIDVSPLCTSKGVCIDGQPLLASGCLAHKDSSSSSAVLNALVVKKQKECLMEINRLLVDAAVKEQLADDTMVKASRITPGHVLQRVACFKKKNSATFKYAGLLQQALGIVQALSSPRNDQLDELLSTEMLLVQNTALSEEGPLRNIIHLLTHRKERSLPLEDILGLIFYLFALAGEDVLGKDKDAVKLKAALVEAIFQDAAELPDYLSDLVGEVVDETNVIAAVADLLSCFYAVGQTRSGLGKYKSVLSQSGPMQPAVYTSLLKQLVQDIFDPTVVEVPDIEFQSGGLSEILKSGFGLFMNVSRSQPGDHPLLIIYVVGGVTATEVRQIKEAVASCKTTEVIICSTQLATPTSILKQLVEELFEN